MAELQSFNFNLSKEIAGLETAGKPALEDNKEVFEVFHTCVFGSDYLACLYCSFADTCRND